MIKMEFKEGGSIQALIWRFRMLPQHIARKHMVAVMRRALMKGVPVLRQNTPPIATTRGRKKAGERRRSTGALRRSVMVRAGLKNKKDVGTAWGALGYRYDGQDRKPIWLNYGTSRNIKAHRMIEKTLQSFGGVAASELASLMGEALEKAAREVASGKNPVGYRRK